MEKINLELPTACYSLKPTDKKLILLKKDETGYYPVTYDVAGEDMVNALNERLGVNVYQRKAMEIGSLFGWDAPAANPQYWYDLEQEKAHESEMYDVCDNCGKKAERWEAYKPCVECGSEWPWTKIV